MRKGDEKNLFNKKGKVEKEDNFKEIMMIIKVWNLVKFDLVENIFSCVVKLVD